MGIFLCFGSFLNTWKELFYAFFTIFDDIIEPPNDKKVLIFLHQQLKNILKLTKKGKKGKIFIIAGDFYPFEQFKLLKNPNFKEALIPPNLKNDEFSKKNI